MNAHRFVKPFIGSVIILPIIYAVMRGMNSSFSTDTLTLMLFLATISVEVWALMQFVRARKSFSKNDPGYLTWTLITGFMIIRLIAEARLLTLTVNLVPNYQEGASAALYFYIIVLRYLYTISDLLFIAALFTTIRSYKSTGLPFNLLVKDYFYMLAVWTLPVITYAFRANLIHSGVIGNDGYLATYRLIAVSVGAVIATVCIMIRRYALQMGGGAVAKVWNMVVIAGVARDGSFLVLALISTWSKPAASFLEQYLLWIFAGCWLLAGMYQNAVFTRATKTHPVYVAESAT
ncbi:MAG: hypothetical protein AB1757_09845 [Acidobacteriota bacterium]